MRLASADGASPAAAGRAWQPPSWLAPVLAVASALLLLAIILLLWFCCCRRKRKSSLSSALPQSSGPTAASSAAAAAAAVSASMPPLEPPALIERPVQPPVCAAGPSGFAAGAPQPSRSSGRQAGKGLLGSRRGSSASLTISLGSSSQQPLHQPLQPSALAERAQERDLLKSLSRPLVPADLLAANPSPQALFKEFWDVPMHHAGRCDLPEGAAPKNRYPTMVPNADTRVTIRQDEYINANFLRGAFRAEKCFIATQGPLADTVTDFWQMIWEQRPSAIVMLTDLVERERPKCHLYFPLHCGDRMRHGQLETVLEELQDCPAGYQRRLLRLTHADHPSEDSALSLQHYWFRNWPDHLSPDSSASMLSLAESCLSLPPPIIVHCSAGLGRTGTFCAICICVRQLRQTGSCDCLATVCQLRLDRGGMVDSHEQYEFVHRVLRLYAQTRMEDSG
ncbi:hypothetical protein BOX15_Mlig030693g2 [Macrostomum lignano]|uniref:protein-tyrosine-phosphatase n=2 Tax=Macrostomum lignano TaxID=282301 RepID=A0A267G7C2_9PLAT|nr:hypothetical protein BOX15_Mlig030693g2 [Macrostomum lignano]